MPLQLRPPGYVVEACAANDTCLMMPHKSVASKQEVRQDGRNATTRVVRAKALTESFIVQSVLHFPSMPSQGSHATKFGIFY